jgi:hypothetical protein
MTDRQQHAGRAMPTSGGGVAVGDRVSYEGRQWIVTATLPFPSRKWTALTIWNLDHGDRHIRDIDLESTR